MQDIVVDDSQKRLITLNDEVKFSVYDITSFKKETEFIACGGTVNGATVTPELNQLMYVINQKPDLEAIYLSLDELRQPLQKVYHT